MPDSHRPSDAAKTRSLLPPGESAAANVIPDIVVRAVPEREERRALLRAEQAVHRPVPADPAASASEAATVPPFSIPSPDEVGRAPPEGALPALTGRGRSGQSSPIRPPPRHNRDRGSPDPSGPPGDRRACRTAVRLRTRGSVVWPDRRRAEPVVTGDWRACTSISALGVLTRERKPTAQHSKKREKSWPSRRFEVSCTHRCR
jgi:hypothetical protein